MTHPPWAVYGFEQNVMFWAMQFSYYTFLAAMGELAYFDRINLMNEKISKLHVWVAVGSGVPLFGYALFFLSYLGFYIYLAAINAPAFVSWLLS